MLVDNLIALLHSLGDEGKHIPVEPPCPPWCQVHPTALSSWDAVDVSGDRQKCCQGPAVMLDWYEVRLSRYAYWDGLAAATVIEPVIVSLKDADLSPGEARPGR